MIREDIAVAVSIRAIPLGERKMSMITKRWTMDEIKTACRVRGSHWFDPGTMRYFKCRILETVYQGSGGVFFVSSEKCSSMYNNHPRRYTVRKFNPESADIDTAGEFNVMTKHMAIKKAKELAGPDHEEANEPFHPVTVKEQFQHDLQTHSGKTVTMAAAAKLMRLAEQHHKLMEDYCNGVEIYTRQGTPRGTLARNRKAITQLLADIGCGVHFGGDPRGCTVKIKFPDGKTNDWGQDGWCVPGKGE